MNNALDAALTVIAGIITVAIISVIVSKKSSAPAAIEASGKFLSGIVAAAVSPVSTSSTNGNLGANPFTNPAGTTASAGDLSWANLFSSGGNNVFFPSLGS